MNLAADKVEATCELELLQESFLHCADSITLNGHFSRSRWTLPSTRKIHDRRPWSKTQNICLWNEIQTMHKNYDLNPDFLFFFLYWLCHDYCAGLHNYRAQTEVLVTGKFHIGVLLALCVLQNPISELFLTNLPPPTVNKANNTEGVVPGCNFILVC